jgi:predicted transcriptional regulator of viral defense system
MEKRHFEDTVQELSGLGKTDRKRLTAVIRRSKGTISVAEAAEALQVSATDAAKMLARWAGKGWLSRVRRGLYVSVPLESLTSDVPLEDPWLIADRLYSPCYIGGWSAAEYWDLTEQIFRSVLVMTIRKPRERTPTIRNTKFVVRTVQENALFGLKPIWRGQMKVSVSDPTRTVVDMLSDPALAGGSRPTADVLLSYLKSESRNVELLIDYAKRLGNGAVFKRLGFLLEYLAPGEVEALRACLSGLTKGNARLDPGLPAERLISRWRLWVPESWIKRGAKE